MVNESPHEESYDCNGLVAVQAILDYQQDMQRWSDSIDVESEQWPIDAYWLDLFSAHQQCLGALADAGDAVAAYHLAWILESGLIDASRAEHEQQYPQRRERVFSLLMSAAEAGMAVAIDNLLSLYPEDQRLARMRRAYQLVDKEHPDPSDPHSGMPVVLPHKFNTVWRLLYGDGI